MFRCQATNRLSNPREKQFSIILEKRPVTYFRRNRDGSIMEDEYGAKIIEGQGWEIAKELKVCEAVYRKWEAEQKLVADAIREATTHIIGQANEGKVCEAVYRK